MFCLQLAYARAPVPANDALAAVKKDRATAERQRREVLAAFDPNSALQRYMLQTKQSLSLVTHQHAPDMQFVGRVRHLPTLQEDRDYAEEFLQSPFAGPFPYTSHPTHTAFLLSHPSSRALHRPLSKPCHG